MIHVNEADRILNIHGEITIADSDQVTAFCQAQAGKPIGVFFNSPGGVLFAAAEMFRAFKAHGDCLGIVDRKAYSGAVIALAGCKIRVANFGAKLMVHATQNIDSDHRELSYQEQRDLGVSDWTQAAYLSEATGRTKDEIYSWVRGTETWFTANQAIACGLVHVVDHSTPSGSDQASHYHLMKIKTRNFRKATTRPNSGYQMFQNGEWVPCEKPKLVDWCGQVQSRDSFGKMFFAKMMQGSGTTADVLLAKGKFPIF